MGSPENSNWVFDYGLIADIHVPGGDLPNLDPPDFSWSSQSFTGPTNLRVELDDAHGNSDTLEETGSLKRLRSGSCNASGSKACREKMRRDKLNDRFLELGSMLDPGRPPKTDKAIMLGDAVRMVSQLRDEVQKLRESNENLHEKINELKAEKNELRDEKLRLKAEKENLERQVNGLSSQPSFLPHPPAVPTGPVPFSAPGQLVGGKLVPFMGYPGVPMWQFLSPAAVDTSQDHVLRPPVA
ncbi:transcription factor ILR3-like [Quillaja saponaria]|uniref:Transcription factor ILR3-like n=1 Tax=Quillaja saponaria TaxID=32244 RepID=A0AAD7M470_QUISA|nr:transcription factor ILR3-like [Quillaja saponaria]